MSESSHHESLFPSESDLRSPLLGSVSESPYKSEPVERLCIDEMLTKYCGEFGRWQRKHFILTSMAWALEALHTMVVIFADREPAWRCTTSGCPDGVKSVCQLEPGSWEWIGGPMSTTVAEFGLICSEKYKVGLVQALFFGGCMIGAGVFGHLSDSKLGRKGALLVVCTLNAIFGCLTALSPNYFVYALLRLLTGFSTGGVGLCAFVLATEPVGPSKRGLAGMSTFYFFSGGIAALSVIAYFFTSWRALYIVTSLPSVVFLIAVLPFFSESPRWYLIRGKIGSAMKIMRKIAEANRTHIPENVMLALDDETRVNSDEVHKTGQEDSDEEAVTGSLIDVVRYPVTRVRLFLAIGINFFCSIIYYGLSLNVVNLGTNLHLNVFVNAVAEMPAFLLTALLIDRLGRKPLSIGTQLFSATFCLIGFCLKGYGVWKTIRMVCGVLGIFGVAATYNLLFIYTMELFPTVVRNAALGSATQAGQLGAILAPLIVVLGERIPFVVFGVCGIMGGVLTFMLPETLNKPLYDTMAGMEEGESESV